MAYGVFMRTQFGGRSYLGQSVLTPTLLGNFSVYPDIVACRILSDEV